MKNLWAYSGLYHFNDANMMCVDIHGTAKSINGLVEKGGMIMTEYKTQFALWCILSSPLTLSFGLSKPIKQEYLALVTHKELIALNQDHSFLLPYGF